MESAEEVLKAEETLKKDLPEWWKEHATRKELMYGGKFGKERLLIAIQVVREEIENKNIAGACYILGEMHQYVSDTKKIIFKE